MTKINLHCGYFSGSIIILNIRTKHLIFQSVIVSVYSIFDLVMDGLSQISVSCFSISPKWENAGELDNWKPWQRQWLFGVSFRQFWLFGLSPEVPVLFLWRHSAFCQLLKVDYITFGIYKLQSLNLGGNTNCFLINLSARSVLGNIYVLLRKFNDIPKYVQ